MESPDGTWLYFSGDNQYTTSLWRVPVAGGKPELVVDRLDYWFSVGRRGVYFQGEKSNQLRYWNALNRTVNLVWEFPTSISLGLSVSPDERELAVSVSNRAGSDILMIAPYR